MALQLWFPLTSNLQNQGIHLTTEGKIPSTCTIASTGKLGQCYVNTGGTVQNTTINITTLAWSLCCWCRVDARTNGWASSIGLNGDNGAYIGIICQNTNGTTGGFHYYSKVSGTNTKIFDDYCLTGPALGEWHHYTMCYDGSKYYVYFDGSLLKQGNAVRSETNHFTAIKLFGSQSGILKGALNDVRFYDECLSAKQVKEISKGLIAHYKFDNIKKGNFNMINNSGPSGNSITGWTALSGASRAARANEFGPFGYVIRATYGSSTVGVHHQPKRYQDLVNGETYTVSAWIRANREMNFYFANEYMIDYNNKIITLTPEWKYYSTTAVLDTSQQYHSNVCYPAAGQTIQSEDWIEICYLKLEKSNFPTIWTPHTDDTAAYAAYTEMQDTVYDSSGYCYDGIITGNIVQSIIPTPRYQSCTKILDNASKITINNKKIYSSENQFSFSVWINTSEKITNSKFFVLGYNENLMINFGHSSTNGTYQFFIFQPSGYIGIQFTAITLNKWDHFAGTFDGTTSKLYKNGELIVSKSNITSYSTNLDLEDTICGNTSTVSEKHSIVDLRFYATTLSATDITELYNTSMEIDSNGNILPRVLE